MVVSKKENLKATSDSSLSNPRPDPKNKLLRDPLNNLSASNLNYLEVLYDSYLQNGKSDNKSAQPSDSPKTWDDLFTSLQEERFNPNGEVNINNGANGNGKISVNSPTPTKVITKAKETSYLEFKRALSNLGVRANGVEPSYIPPKAAVQPDKQNSYDALVYAYRHYGHKKAAKNPLVCKTCINSDELELAAYNLSEQDMQTKFSAKNLRFGDHEITLADTIEHLEKIYCGSIGYEFMYLSDKEKKNWFLDRTEILPQNREFSDEMRLRILERLVAATGLESSLSSKYPGTKRFGLEGAEVMIPMVDNLVQSAGAQGLKEIVIAMAHRGRLNMLVNILGKNPASLFDEFEGKYKRINDQYFGDVKYHQGFSCNLDTDGGELHLALAFNPSHLEIVSPVAEGSVRARQERRKDKEGDTVMPIILHGDASFSGQGVVMETLQMSKLQGFKTGGSIHIILNNQIGFTVSNVGDARSTEYASDIAKMLEAPIIHVNAEDPEAVIFAADLAMEYRMKYHSDIVVDVLCYRKYGHNEADEPAITQPQMYSEIRKRQPVADIYAKELIAKSLLKDNDYQAMKDEYRDQLDKSKHVTRSLATKPNSHLFVDWEPYLGHDWEDDFDTSISISELQTIGKSLAKLPQDFKLHRQVQKVFADRAAMLVGEKPVDWGYAELLAYGSLVRKGHPVRMSGQDSRRGTFSHRHAVVHNQQTGESYCALENMAGSKASFNIYDSFLSEEAAMAFEYGYATTDPNALVLWEGQFGDFANGAQVVIDQFLSSGETKWQRLCGLVLLLPHGYEGQGPEHSSARLERYLQLCADNNMQVCIPSTAGQVFHMLRRQIIRPLRKPLVVMMPKSLLRKEISSVMIKDLAKSKFLTVIDETDKKIKAKDVDRVILCSGKIYYELIAHRQKMEDKKAAKNTAIVRMEQIYPFPHSYMNEILGKFSNTKYLVWCQEEPMNQGAWYSCKHHLDLVNKNNFPEANLLFAGRVHSASPATGYMGLHVSDQNKLIEEAFSLQK